MRTRTLAEISPSVRHEAAHVVACLALGGRVLRATKNCVWHYGSSLSKRDMAIVALAGQQYVKETRVSKSDLRWVMEYTGPDPSIEMLTGLVQETRALIDEHRPEIETMSRFLQSESDFDGKKAALVFWTAQAVKTAVGAYAEGDGRVPTIG